MLRQESGSNAEWKMLLLITGQLCTAGVETGCGANYQICYVTCERRP